MRPGFGQLVSIRFGTNGSLQLQFDYFVLDASSAVPEPTTAALGLLGILGLGLRRRRNA